MREVLLGREVGPHGFERPVVLKRILPHLARDPAFVAMFVDEARIVATIRHANVVQVHELLQHEDELALVMEYLEGESADSLLKRLESRSKRLPYALAAHIAATACAGLHAAHELTDADGTKRQVVHRDISPHNLFITYDGQVKLIDFGIALAAGRTGTTETGQIKGKFSYMSPEQCSGDPLDRRSDIFSLGAVLFELATGHRAFKRKTDLMTMRAICEDPLVEPSSAVEGFPSELEAVIMRALARRREERFETAAEMRRELLAVVRKLPPLEDAPDAALGSLMADMFDERVTEKRGMLRRVASGEDLEVTVSTEVDEGTVLPTAMPRDPTRTASNVWATRTRRGQRSRTFLWGAGLAAVAGVALVVTLPRIRGSSEATPVASPSPASPSSVAALPIAAASVKFQVDSVPRGAQVELGGKPLGTTPLSVSVLAGAAPRKLRVTHEGHLPFVDHVRMTADKQLMLQLEPQAQATQAAPVAPSPKTHTPPKASASAKAGRAFHPFD